MPDFCCCNVPSLYRQSGRSTPASMAALTARFDSVQMPVWCVSYNYPPGAPHEDKPRPAYTRVGVQHQGAVAPLYWNFVRRQPQYKAAFGLTDQPVNAPRLGPTPPRHGLCHTCVNGFTCGSAQPTLCTPAESGTCLGTTTRCPPPAMHPADAITADQALRCHVLLSRVTRRTPPSQ